MILRWHNDFWMLWVFSRVLTTDNGIIKRPCIGCAGGLVIKRSIERLAEMYRLQAEREAISSKPQDECGPQHFSK
jgi:hypothetical protein